MDTGIQRTDKWVSSPWTVKAAEGVFVFYALIVAGLYVWGSALSLENDSGQIPSLVIGLILVSAFHLALALAVHMRQRFASTLAWTLEMVAVGFVCIMADFGAPVYCLATLVYALPLVFLFNPVSSSWFASSGRNSWKILGVLVLLFLAELLLPALISPMSRSPVGHMSFLARSLFARIVENRASQEAGGVWVDPSTCSNSTDYVRRLFPDANCNGLLVAGQCPWSIAINAPDHDMFPVLVSCNVDLARLFCAELDPSRWWEIVPLSKNPLLKSLGDRYAVIVRAGGASCTFKRKYVRPRLVFGEKGVLLDRTVDYLTPTGRITVGTRPPSTNRDGKDLRQ